MIALVQKSSVCLPTARRDVLDDRVEQIGDQAIGGQRFTVLAQLGRDLFEVVELVDRAVVAEGDEQTDRLLGVALARAAA